MLLINALIDSIEISTLFPTGKHSFEMMGNCGTATKRVLTEGIYL